MGNARPRAPSHERTDTLLCSSSASAKKAEKRSGTVQSCDQQVEAQGHPEQIQAGLQAAGGEVPHGGKSHPDHGPEREERRDAVLTGAGQTRRGHRRQGEGADHERDAQDDRDLTVGGVGKDEADATQSPEPQGAGADLDALTGVEDRPVSSVPLLEDAHVDPAVVADPASPPREGCDHDDWERQQQQ